MTRKDTAVVGALVVSLAVIAGLVGIPALQATFATPSASPAASGYAASRAYREGVVGHPVSVSPLTARTQADRDLVALVFSGLVRNGPERHHRAGPRRALVGRRGRASLDVRAPAGRPLARRGAGHRGRRGLHDRDPAGPGVHRARCQLLDGGDGPRGVADGGHLHARYAPRRVPPGGDPADRAGPPARRGAGRAAAGSSVRAAAGRVGSVRPVEPRRGPGGPRPRRDRDPARRRRAGPVRRRHRFARRRRSRRSDRSGRRRTCPASSSASTTTPRRSPRRTGRAGWTGRRVCHRRSRRSWHRPAGAGSCAIRARP